MLERIKKLQELTLAGKMRVECVPTEYDRGDLLLRPIQMSAKRVSEYILNQEPMITEYSVMTGQLRFDGSVEGNAFSLEGHKNVGGILKAFYNKPADNVATLEWQHSVGDFAHVIDHGLKAILSEIEASRKSHTLQDELDFLDGVESVVRALIGWAGKCSRRAAEKAHEVDNPAYRANLMRLSETLERIPYEPAGSFYEAVLSLYICFSMIPDSIGTIDRTFRRYYIQDIERGVLTQEEAAAYLQELYLMIQSWTPVTSDRFTRGGESHFCIGGYLENGEDGFNETSRLVLDSLLELDTYIPQISLRWTKKMAHEDFYYVNDRARRDAHQRIAFVNDEPRIRAWMDIVGLPWEVACSYCMAGCNEPNVPGGRIMGTINSNITKFLGKTLNERRSEVLAAKSFDAFYRIAEEELCQNLDEIIWYDTAFNAVRARDCNLVSSIFFKGCIKNARSVTQKGCDYTTGMIDAIGLTTAIDSLIIIDQFVYDEKLCTMEEMLSALDDNWAGHEDLHTLIMKKGRFFGNDDEKSNQLARQFYDSIYRHLEDKRDFMGKRFLLGDLIGYNQHNVWFGQATGATPDGRYAGEPISFGRGQSQGRDRNGLTALLNSITACDPHHLVSGPTVTNLMLDEQMVRDDMQFEKLVWLLEAYFRREGMHYQLNYVSREELLAARENPAQHENLRVRVSGFSDNYVRLNKDLQDEILTRTNIQG